MSHWSETRSPIAQACKNRNPSAAFGPDIAPGDGRWVVRPSSPPRLPTTIAVTVERSVSPSSTVGLTEIAPISRARFSARPRNFAAQKPKGGLVHMAYFLGVSRSKVARV